MDNNPCTRWHAELNYRLISPQRVARGEFPGKSRLLGGLGAAGSDNGIGLASVDRVAAHAQRPSLEAANAQSSGPSGKGSARQA
jgi:hypothetical protein